jgi:hypothetical protein
MRFVVQQIPSGVWGEGDCATASTASVLDRSLDEIPDFRGNACLARGEYQTAAIMKYIKSLGLGCEMHYDREAYAINHDFSQPWPPDKFDARGLAVALTYFGPPPKPGDFSVTHAVVALDGKLFWDPLGYAASGRETLNAYAWIFPLRNGERLRPTRSCYKRHRKLRAFDGIRFPSTRNAPLPRRFPEPRPPLKAPEPLDVSAYRPTHIQGVGGWDD